MRNFTRNNVLAFASCAALLFSACGDDSKNAGGSVEDQEIIAISEKIVTGVSQKGPFVNGSSVTVQELNGETLAQTGLGFEGKIKNDMGEFSVKVNKLESQYALLKANGFYRNEVTGEKSKSQITLYALTDLSKRDEVNVNLLTHLAYERSLYLATEDDSVSVAEAKKQAETEVLKSFEIEGDFGDAEDLNIFGESDQSAALLAISVLMQGNLSEGDFSERLANYAADIESDGVWNDTKTATQIADWAITQSMSGGLALIRNNIAGWNLSTGVPAFEKYVDNFWWQNYGLGTCDKERAGEVMKNQNAASVYADKYFICRSNLWYVATALEYDTYEWKDGKDGDVKNGDVVKENCYVFEDSSWRLGQENDCSLELRGCTQIRQDTVGLGKDSMWYVCNTKSWRHASTYEKDTFGWKDSTDGTIKKGNVTDNMYVFDETAWRMASDVEVKLGCCLNAIADSVGEVLETHYICENRKWREATDFEKDTYKWKEGKDGEVRPGQVNENVYYIYEEDNKTWRNATTYEKDTYGWKEIEDASVRKGNVTDTFYVYEKKSFRIATAREKYIKEGCTNYNEGRINVVSDTSDYICSQGEWIVHKDVLVDSRDGQTYSTVRIGSQIWMAQDLNYADSIAMENLKGASWCQGGKITCDRRYYYWNSLMDLSSEYQTGKFGNSNRKGVCPDHWRMASKEDWQALIDFIGGPEIAMNSLWEAGCGSKDVYGFGAQWNEGGHYTDDDYGMPRCTEENEGYCINGDDIYFWATGGSYYWTSSEEDDENAYYVTLEGGAGSCDDGRWIRTYNCHRIDFEHEIDVCDRAPLQVELRSENKNHVFSVRCIKDEDE